MAQAALGGLPRARTLRDRQKRPQKEGENGRILRENVLKLSNVGTKDTNLRVKIGDLGHNRALGGHANVGIGELGGSGKMGELGNLDRGQKSGVCVRPPGRQIARETRRSRMDRGLGDGSCPFS